MKVLTSIKAYVLRMWRSVYFKYAVVCIVGILLVGFLVSAMFITYAVSNIAGILNMPDERFIQDDKSYVGVVQKKIPVGDYLEIESDPTVEYALPGSGKISMRMKFDEYWQTSWSGTILKGSLSSFENLTGAPTGTVNAATITVTGFSGFHAASAAPACPTSPRPTSRSS